jgi:hypothetical protein
VKCQLQARAGALKLYKRATTKKAQAAASGSLLMRPPREVLEKLWALPEPAMHNHGLAVDPKHLLQRLDTEPAFAARYWQVIGTPYQQPEPDETVAAIDVGDPDDSDGDDHDEDDDDDEKRRSEGQSGAGFDDRPFKQQRSLP